ncbi:MAG: hypothetical protein J5685_09655 [Clostridiales bacterium]|nr:hypothetical protein [Clostridiales bacterium]
MYKEFRRNLGKIIHLRSIIGYNSLIFALKKTPLIGKLVPDSLYGSSELKVIYWIIHIIKESFKLFIGKIFGLGMIYLASLVLMTAYRDYDMVSGVSEPVLYGSFSLFLFILYALGGILINTSVFRCTTEKEYLVFMLRMDPRKLNNTLFAYDLIKLFIGYLIAGIAGILFGAPVWIWLGIPFLAIFIKFFGAGATALIYKIRHTRNKSMKKNPAGYVIRITLVMLLFPIIFIILVNGFYVPLWITGTAAALLFVLGLWGLHEYSAFDSSLHRRALLDNIVREEAALYKEPDTTKQFKHLTAAGTVRGDKKGFEYLNSLFVRRHRKILFVRPVVFGCMIALIAGFVIFEFIAVYKTNFGAESCRNMVLHNLLNMLLFRHYEDPLQPYIESSAFSFFRWVVSKHLLLMIIPVSMADNSFKATQAMYINCDNSLMTFSFFKQREKIIRLFDIRFRQLIRIDLAPVLALGLVSDLILFYTGGQDYPFEYLLTVLCILLISSLFCLSRLALYYLIQPFTTTVNVKSGAYVIARCVLAFMGSLVFWIPLNSLILFFVLTVINVISVISVRKLVYKNAPKTWKVKS